MLADATWPIDVTPVPVASQRRAGSPAPQRMAVFITLLQLPSVPPPCNAASGGARFLSSQLAAWPRGEKSEVPLPRVVAQALAELPPLKRKPAAAAPVPERRRRRKPIAPMRCVQRGF